MSCQKLAVAGWTDERIGEQRIFTAGRILVQGRKASRAKPKRADYRSPADGMQQAKSYAETLELLFAYATNGHGILEFDHSTGLERPIDAFPSPKELWNCYRAANGLDEALEDKLLVPNHISEQIPRYYQQIAINRAVEAILSGKRRVLLTLATGSGKTVIAFQIAWKLWNGRWNVKATPKREPRILFLADRTVLVNDPKDKTFAPFGDARWRIGGGKVNKGRNLYLSTYQALSGDETRTPLYREFAPDFFDLVIVDEAHRGSARGDSNWREILEYFTGAVQLGMTATPKRQDNVDTYDYFGDPVYTYSLRQGIQDGFLAPYQVRRVVTDVDAEGYRPYPGQLDDLGREIPDKEYTSRDFERNLSLMARTEAVARHLTAYLKATDRFAKTIVFCVDQEHASQMRQALANANSDLTRQYPNYVVRVTGDEGDLGREMLSKFQDVEEKVPVILTTSQMLTTGVDAPLVKNVVLFRHINSMTDFKQIIGCGTRVREDYGKLFFTILDYTGAATQNFADPSFDGEPARATVEKMDEQGETETTSDVEEPLDEQGAEDETPPEEVIYVVEPARLLQTRERQEPRKYYLTNGVEVRIIDEMEAALDASGRKLRTVQLTTYTGEQVKTLVRDPDALRRSWAHADERERIVAALEERGITLEHLAAVMEQPEADPFDLLCHLAFSAPLSTRSQRAERVRRKRVTSWRSC